MATGWGTCANNTQTSIESCVDNLTGAASTACTSAAPTSLRACGQQLFSRGGSYNWSLPAGVASATVSVYVIGAGGGGSALPGSGSSGIGLGSFGGGAGGEAISTGLTVNSGQSFSIAVGIGGAAGSDGQPSSITLTQTAQVLLQAAGGGTSGDSASLAGFGTDGGACGGTYSGPSGVDESSVCTSSATGVGGPNANYPSNGGGGDAGASGEDGIVVIIYN